MNLDTLRERLPYQPLLLGCVALLAGAALSYANQATRAQIALAEARDMQATLAQVLPDGLADNDLLHDVVELPAPEGPRKIHLARRQGVTTAAVFEVAARGYAGPIRLLMAVDRDGAVLGVRVLKHQETPGLGDKIEIAKHDWITRFAGTSLTTPDAARWAVKKDGGQFDQFAGATITPRAVVRAVKGGLDYFADHRAAILSGTDAPASGKAGVGNVGGSNAAATNAGEGKRS